LRLVPGLLSDIKQ